MKYLILLLVLVFDPLAISLVIASSEALQARGKKDAPVAGQSAQSVAASVAPQAQPVQPLVAVAPVAAASPSPAPEGHVVHMRFAPEKDEKAV